MLFLSVSLSLTLFPSLSFFILNVICPEWQFSPLYCINYMCLLCIGITMHKNRNLENVQWIGKYEWARAESVWCILVHLWHMFVSDITENPIPSIEYSDNGIHTTTEQSSELLARVDHPQLKVVCVCWFGNETVVGFVRLQTCLLESRNACRTFWFDLLEYTSSTNSMRFQRTNGIYFIISMVQLWHRN